MNKQIAKPTIIPMPNQQLYQCKTNNPRQKIDRHAWNCFQVATKIDHAQKK